MLERKQKKRTSGFILLSISDLCLHKVVLRVAMVVVDGESGFEVFDGLLEPVLVSIPTQKQQQECNG